MCPTVVIEICLPSGQLSSMALFACYGQCLVSVMLRGQTGSSFSLNWVRPVAHCQLTCQNCGDTELQGILSVLSPKRLSLVGGACSQTRCLLGLQ